MTNIEGIVMIEANSGLPLFSRLDGIDEALFSGFLTAIKSFSAELNLGGLNSFTTEEKHIHLIGREKVITALIASSEDNPNRILSVGLQLGRKFEEDFNDILDNNNYDMQIFDPFANFVNNILKESEVPFLVEVVDFVKKEYGGDLAIESTVQNLSNERVKIDIISDRGDKKPKSFRDRFVKRTLKGFSEDVVFFKVIDGIAGKNEVISFIESMKTYGTRQGESSEGVFPYFPSKCVIIARGYSPTIMEEMEKYPKRSDKAFIGPSHIMGHPGATKATPSALKCFIELWKWQEGKNFPEIFFS